MLNLKFVRLSNTKINAALKTENLGKRKKLLEEALQIVSNAEVAQISVSKAAGIGEKLFSDPIGARYVSVLAGTYPVGDKDFSDNQPRNIEFAAFMVGETVVTQEQYLKVMGENPSYFSKAADRKDRPVEKVDWFNAIAYCQKLSFLADDIAPAIKKQIQEMKPKEYAEFALKNPQHKLYRLLTELEWDAVAHGLNGKDKYATANGKLNKKNAVYDTDQTAPVKSKKPNRLGIYGLTGNVWEWAMDAIGWGRVLRGGSWLNNYAERLRSGYRCGDDPGHEGGGIGFRVARSN